MPNLDKLQAFVQAQIADPKLWSVEMLTDREDYVQLQLRKLHAAVETYAFGRDNAINWYWINYERK